MTLHNMTAAALPLSTATAPRFSSLLLPPPRFFAFPFLSLPFPTEHHRHRPPPTRRCGCSPCAAPSLPPPTRRLFLLASSLRPFAFPPSPTLPPASRTNPKIVARRRSLIASSPSSPPPLPTSKKRKYANQPQAPSSPPHEVETPKKPKRAEAEHPQNDARTPDAAATAEAKAEAVAVAVAVAGKYWAHWHSLFSLYDRGVRMDAEGWYSATPEAVAAAQAARATPAGLVVDAFAGVGGNSIQFAARGCYMVAVEIDPRKVELAAHNARIYGVEDRIEFVVGDFFRLAPFLKADLVFLSPPWGGPSYNQTPIYTLDMLKPKDRYAIFQAAQGIAPNIVMFLPRNVDIRQVEELTWLSSPPLDFESEENHIQHTFKGITAYFGNTARGPSSLPKQR